MAATGKILGTVTSVVGEAKATAADGTVRILQVGDTVRSDETITTSAAGAVNIALENGKTLDCGANTDLSLHESILGVSTAAVTSKPAAPGSVEALQQAIASGQDPSQVAPATAAGGAPAAGGAGGDGGGGSPVIIEQANTAGVVESGFPTAGGAIGFPTPEFELQNPEEEPPAVSVSVQVQVQVQVEVEVDVSIEAQPVVNGPSEGGVFAVSASGDAVSLIEGTQEGTMTIPFVITLDKVFDTDVQVTYQIVPDSASSPSDFFDGDLTQTITIPAGETSFIVPIQIVRDHFVEGHESFHIVLLDAENATINPDKDTASVTIFNDDANPVANDDTNWAQEDTAVVAVGNVLNNVAHPGDPSVSVDFADAADTDNFETPTVTNPGTYAGAHGTLVLNANGTYTYTLNNASAAVQALDSGETLTETFGYTITDGFNTPDSATLTVTIFGSNDVPEITVKTSGDIFASGAQGTVDEAALSNGSNSASDAEFVTGSFKVADTDGVEDIQTVTINGQEVAIANLVGAVFHGSAGDMTVTAYADGVATFTYELLHAVTHNQANQTAPDVFTLIASDGTSDSAPANVTISILDDVPSTQVTASPATSALTVDETDLGTNATANFAGDFAGGSSFGADGPGTVSDAIYTLSINGGSTGLVDTATNQAVTLAMNGSVVEGRVSNGEGGFFVVFTVSVDGSGNVTLDQQRAVVHTPDNGPDQSTSLASADLVVLNRTATITDADGDTANASASINIGQALNFEDDAPSIDVSATQAADPLTVDESELEGDASANFADNFNSSSSFGADGAGSLSSGYALSVNAGSSGLVDTATNQAVTLVMNGSAVEGRVPNGEGGFFVVFTLSVDGSGTVTLDQMRAVVHANASNPDDSTGIGSNLLILTRTDTITDEDGDVAIDSATIDVGSAITFKDDGPSINVTLEDVGADSLTVDESVLGTDDSASYADNFAGTSSFGADGAGTLSTVYSLSVKSAGVASGLTDTATNQSVVLTVNGSGEVEGRTAISGDLVFKVSVDASGNVTLDQQRAVVHSPNTGPDQSTSLAASDLIVLTRKDTITDKDGDSAESSQNINIGQALNFEDDAPTLAITGGDTSVTEGQSILNGAWTSTTGADVAATTKVVIGETEFDLGEIDTGKGMLTINAGGTWTFVAAPNQSNPQVVSFSIKITDKDGDVASDSHTITIDDGLDPAVSGGQVMTVNEAALFDGTNSDSNGETDSATLTFTSGSDAIASMVFASTAGITVTGNGLDDLQSITWAISNGGRTLTGTMDGTPVIQIDLSGATSVAAGGTTGDVTVTATLLNNVLNENSPNASDFVVNGIKVVGTDSDGDTATHTFTGVTVVDDAPTLSAQSIAVNHTTAHYSGNYTFADGADDSSYATAFAPGSLTWTNRPSDVTFTHVGGNKYVATFQDGDVTVTYFEITVQDGGTYDFNLVTPPQIAPESSGELFGALVEADLDGNGSTEAAVADASNFGGAFELILTGSEDDGATYGGDTLIQKSNTDIGVNGNSIQEQHDERVKFDVVQQPGFENATINRLTLEIPAVGSLAEGDRVDLHVVFTDGDDTTLELEYDDSGSMVFDIPTGKVVDYLELIPVEGNVTMKVTGIEIIYSTNINPDDDKLDFTLTAVDGDGDSATANFSVTVIAGTDDDNTLFTGNGNDSVSGGGGDDSISTAGGNDILVGGEGDDTLIGGAGNDTLIGGDGSDTYVFTGVLNASNSDTVTGFNLAPLASGGDVLNLHDVLPGAAQGQTTEGALSAYVIVQSGANTTISVDADGGGIGAPVLVVTLEGVNTTLAQLLNNNQIVT